MSPTKRSRRTDFTLFLSALKVRPVLVFLCLMLWGPLYRSALDKIWVVVGNLSLLGQWAQLQSVIDLIAAPNALSIGIGLTVLTAQSSKTKHVALLKVGYLLGLMITAPIGLATFIAGPPIAQWLGLEIGEPTPFSLACACGLLSTPIALVTGYWLGQNQRVKVLGLLVLTNVPVVMLLIAGGYLNWTSLIEKALLCNIAILLLCHGLLVIQLFKHSPFTRSELVAASKPLMHYLPAGFSTGLLTPASVFIGRSTIANHLNWDALGSVTALWDISAWALNSAQTVLNFYFLPLLSRQVLTAELRSQIGKIIVWVGLPCLLYFALALIFQNDLLHVLYTAQLEISRSTSALFWVGEFVRILAAIFVIGLYAQRSTRQIAFWELFSQPLFTLLLILGFSRSLQWIGMSYLVSYTLYAIGCAAGFYWQSKRATRT